MAMFAKVFSGYLHANIHKTWIYRPATNTEIVPDSIVDDVSVMRPIIN
jgi:hypothetical protein